MKLEQIKAKAMRVLNSFKDTKKLFSAKMIGTMAICTLMMITFGYSAFEKDIIIYDEESAVAISTFQGNVEDALKEAAITLNQEDVINLNLEDKLKDGTIIEISRAKDITICVDGETKKISTGQPTVEEAIAKAGIVLGELDRVEPEISTEVSTNMEVNVIRVEERLESKSITIPFQSQKELSPDLEKGVEKILKKGTNGAAEITNKVTYENGVAIKVEQVQQKILQEPVAQVMQTGTLDMVAVSRGNTVRFKEVKTMYATAYDLCYGCCEKNPGDRGYGITATGIKAKVGVVGVDPKVIPFGTWIYVPGIGELVAADKGGGLKGNRLDVFRNDHNFSPRNVKVYILDKPKFNFKTDTL